jgi:hypothetical protein
LRGELWPASQICHSANGLNQNVTAFILLGSIMLHSNPTHTVDFSAASYIAGI